MCEPISAGALALQGLGGIMSAGGAYAKARADKGAREYQAAVERNKAQFYEMQARDAIARGALAITQQRLKTAQIMGAQRARFAARGLDLHEGSPLNILMDTEFMGNLDVKTIQQNAEREAYVLRLNARTAEGNAGFLLAQADAISPSREAFTALLSGAGSVASSWYRLSKVGAI